MAKTGRLTLRSVVVALALGASAISTFCPSTLLARTWYIRGDGGGESPTIQAAIDSSSHGDVILVAPGTYFETINLRGKAIALRSEAGPGVTVIDGSHSPGSVVTCMTGETSGTIIEGFTITGGSGTELTATSHYGGGILCYLAKPTIRGNWIQGNRVGDGASDWGGGILYYGHIDDSPITIEHNVIRDNYSYVNGGGAWLEGPCTFRHNRVIRNQTRQGDGAGIYIVRAPVSVTENHFIENISGDRGGAIYVNNSGSLGVLPEQIQIQGNVILRNEASSRVGLSCSGGGIFAYGGATILNNTVAFNVAQALEFPAGGAVCIETWRSGTHVERNIIYRNSGCGIGTYFSPAGAVPGAFVRANIIFSNGPLRRCESPPGEGVVWEDNIQQDPLFCDPAPWSDGKLASNSPAFKSPHGYIGAYDAPECSPDLPMAYKRTSWGNLKTRYGLQENPAQHEDR